MHQMRIRIDPGHLYFNNKIFFQLPREQSVYFYAVLRIQDVNPGSGFPPIPDQESNKKRAGKK
jgi:hypothetical protein